MAVDQDLYILCQDPVQYNSIQWKDLTIKRYFHANRIDSQKMKPGDLSRVKLAGSIKQDISEWIGSEFG